MALAALLLTPPALLPVGPAPSRRVALQGAASAMEEERRREEERQRRHGRKPKRHGGMSFLPAQNSPPEGLGFLPGGREPNFAEKREYREAIRFWERWQKT